MSVLAQPLDKQGGLAPLLATLEQLPPELQVLEQQISPIELLATGRNIGYSAFDLGFASDSAFIAFLNDTTGITRTPGSNKHLTTGNKNELPLNITCVILHA